MNSRYDKRIKKYHAYFEKNGIDLRKPRYPIRYLQALRQLIKEKLRLSSKLGNNKANLSERSDTAAGKHTTYWPFLSALYLSVRNPEFIQSQNLPYTLSDFCQHTCDGNLDEAVKKIDELIDLALDSLKKHRHIKTKNCGNNLTMHIDCNPEYQYVLIEELRLNSSFIRDVEYIVHKDRIRPEKNHEHRKSTKSKEEIKNQPPKSNPCDSDLKKVIGKLKKIDADMENIEYKEKPLYPSSKGQLDFTVAGNCLVCHRPSEKTEFYCKPHKDANKVQTPQDRINHAFFKLGYLLQFEKKALITYLTANENYKNKSLVIPYDRLSFNNICNDYILSSIETQCKNTKNIFRDKAYFLHGWGLHHPQHGDFCVGLTEIKNKHSCDADDNVWQIKHLFMLNEITILAKKHKHTQKIIKDTKGLFAGIETELIPKTIQSGFLDIDDDVIISPYQFIKIVERMSIFSLIRLAAGKNLSSLLESSTYRKADLINQFTTDTINGLLNAPLHK